ncbi:Exonuclease family protein [Spironucleus salmonicida]|uniref:Exonuclease family protein n=1 Tax=Spironucleus salmonicida TaxID=348837 RepID=V6LGB1_9EUKA|nr:Exonuclease family protein [Spironucleus salmonicida]|eukprot:EST42706.1 Exonuclease family protein [Spironucleus salmonicida]
MGITGLNENMTGQQTSLKSLQNKSIGIDGHCLLHKAAQNFSQQLLIHKSVIEIANQTYKYLLQFVKYSKYTILVFDGGYLPAKRPTNEARKINRDRSLKEAISSSGSHQTKLLQKSISFTFEQVKDVAEFLISKFQNEQFYCFLSPFEADAQLAFLNRTNLADVIITLDSDIYLYGVDQVLFNYNFGLNSGKLVLNCENTLFTEVQQLKNCSILSGCDYLGSLKGVGLKKAQQAILQGQTALAGSEILKKGKNRDFPEGIVNMSQYQQRILEALVVFQYQRVYNPIDNNIQMLSDCTQDQILLDKFGDIIGEQDSLFNVFRNSKIIQDSCQQLRIDLKHNFIHIGNNLQIIEAEKLNVDALKLHIIQSDRLETQYQLSVKIQQVQKPEIVSKYHTNLSNNNQINYDSIQFETQIYTSILDAKFLQ